MNRKQLILLIVVGVVVGGFGLYSYRARNTSWEESGQKLGQKLVKNFPINDVERITIKQGQGQLNLAKKNDLWAVQERGDYPANFETISELLRKVWDLKVAQPVEIGASSLARLELVAPDIGTNGGTLVDFKDKGGKTLNSLLLGKKHMRESKGDASPFGGGGGGWPDGRYVMVGSDLKTVSVVSEPFSNIETKPEDWLNKDFFKVEKLKSIAVTSTNATNNWKLSRESETNEWKLADLKSTNEVLDVGKISWAGSALSSPSFTDVATNSAPEQTGLNHPLLARLETLEGFVYDLKAGNKISPEKDDFYFQIAVSGNFVRERAPGKDEKPEEKTKLDKEFQDKVKKLEEKLKAEKAYEKWTYIVSKWTVDPLFKERKDLLQEKKEEPKVTEKKDDSKPAEPTPLKPVATPPLPTPAAQK
jgi:hypothetical protein